MLDVAGDLAEKHGQEEGLAGLLIALTGQYALVVRELATQLGVEPGQILDYLHLDKLDELF